MITVGEIFCSFVRYIMENEVHRENSIDFVYCWFVAPGVKTCSIALLPLD